MLKLYLQTFEFEDRYADYLETLAQADLMPSKRKKPMEMISKWNANLLIMLSLLYLCLSLWFCLCVDDIIERDISIIHLFSNKKKCLEMPGCHHTNIISFRSLLVLSRRINKSRINTYSSQSMIHAIENN